MVKKNKNMKGILLITISFLCFIQTNASNYKYTNNEDTVYYKNETFKNTIHTVLIYKKNRELSFPIIDINGTDKIELCFDELVSKPKSYFWKIIHCNSNWQKSDLQPIEYAEGFCTGNITNYNYSKNTTINYINYKATFPNDEVKLLKSGNYIIKIFEDGNEQQVILTKRFYAIEKTSNINAKYNKWTPASLQANNQQIDIDILYSNHNLIDAANELEVKIYKNQEIQRNTKNINPNFIQGRKYTYSQRKELTFPGGNEFRHVNLKNLTVLSDRTENISFKNDTFVVDVKTDYDDKAKEYRYREDINGKFLVTLENSNESNVTADYAYVNFSLYIPLNLYASGAYYLFGQISNWQTSNKFKMKYNQKEKKYKITLFLKQGYYNYQYIFITEDKFYRDNLLRFKSEGNYYHTENDYYILLYHKDKIDGYDKLVGYKKINTILNLN